MMEMKNERTPMRTVTLRVPDAWRGLVDSWAVQVMLKDFSRSHVLSELAVDPQPGHARLSFSLPEFRTDGISESVFLRRLIASYLPALKSFRSSQRALVLPRFQGRPSEIEPRIGQQKALPANSEVRAESGRHERKSGYGCPRSSGLQQRSRGLEEAGNSHAAPVLPGRGESLFRALIVLSIVVILITLLVFRASGASAKRATGVAPMPGYQPWIPTRF
jgi:hypothetical protein